MFKRSRGGEVALATLILFIALILVASITVGILISSGDAVNTKALTTAKNAVGDIGYSFQLIDLYGIDGSSSNSLDYLFGMFKVSSGSEKGDFNKTVLELGLKNASQTYNYQYDIHYTYNWTIWNGTNCTADAASNESIVNSTLINVSYSLDCENFNATIYLLNVNYSIHVNSSGDVCPQNASNGSVNLNNITLQNVSISVDSDSFSVTKTKPASGTIENSFIGGDVFQVCLKSPRSIGQDEKVYFSLVPAKGDPYRTKILTPAVINEERAYLYP